MDWKALYSQRLHSTPILFHCVKKEVKWTCPWFRGKGAVNGKNRLSFSFLFYSACVYKNNKAKFLKGWPLLTVQRVSVMFTLAFSHLHSQVNCESHLYYGNCYRPHLPGMCTHARTHSKSWSLPWRSCSLNMWHTKGGRRNRGKVMCPRSPRRTVTEPESEPRTPASQFSALSTRLCCIPIFSMLHLIYGSGY